jgi:RHH-type proline utilization regulon transcriptional repressor/proline dehydrogenase/delta 1-pyrroline-5-carboxylate dehydrogenase
VQPFGGEGKSGTGPKAGGPLYIKRLQREAAPLMQHERQADPALAALSAWARSKGQAQVAGLADQYAGVSLTGVALDLPGPTGERNRLSFAPRGGVLCAPATAEGALNQFAAVFSTGNRALVLKSVQQVVPADLPQQVRDRISFVSQDDLADVEFQAALLERGTEEELRTSLAARPGAIVALIDTSPQGVIPVWRLVAERALCVNTTAAGGNASLMTLGV